MRERISLAGGTLELRSNPGHGTTILAALPARYRDERSAGAWPQTGGGAHASEPAA